MPGNHHNQRTHAYLMKHSHTRLHAANNTGTSILNLTKAEY